MNISLESDLDPWSLYLYSMKSPVTKEKYIRRLDKFLNFVDIQSGTTQVKAKSFAVRASTDNTWAINEVIRFLMEQKERVERREITGATVRNYVKSIKLFEKCQTYLLHGQKLQEVYLRVGGTPKTQYQQRNNGKD